MKNRHHIRLIPTMALTIAATIAAGTITGCGSFQSSTQYYTDETASYTDETAAMPDVASTYSNMETAEEYDGDAGRITDISEAGLTSSATIHPVVSSRKLIHTINLVVETTTFDVLIDTLTQEIANSGGYVESSEIDGNTIGDATMVVRIPFEKLDSFVEQVDQHGNIIKRSENTQDVTLKYSDIESRKKTLSMEQDRLWELLAKAESMESVIVLESRLSEICYQLESMESQLRTYDNQVDYSTVHLEIKEILIFTPTPIPTDSVATRIQKGFNRNLKQIENNAVDFIVWLISSLPIMLVYAVFTGIFVIIVRVLVKRYQKHRRKHQKTAITKGEDSIPPTKDL